MARLRFTTRSASTPNTSATTRYIHVRSASVIRNVDSPVNCKPKGLANVRPRPPLSYSGRIQTSCSITSANPMVSIARYRSPMRRLGSAMRSPKGTAMKAPARIAAQMGNPASLASRAAANAPMPANVICDRAIMPPSPVTNVYERKMIASAMPVVNTEIQKLSKPTPKMSLSAKRTGSATSATAPRSGPIGAPPPVGRRERRRVALHGHAGAAIDRERFALQALGAEAVADEEHQHHEERDRGRHALREESAVRLVLDPDLLREPDAERADERERQAGHPARSPPRRRNRPATA